MSRYVAIAFALLVVCTLTSAPRAELSPPPAYLVGGNSAPAPAGDGISKSVLRRPTWFASTACVLRDLRSVTLLLAAVRLRVPLAGARRVQRARRLRWKLRAARFPVLRASSNAIYGLLHPEPLVPACSCSSRRFRLRRLIEVEGGLVELAGLQTRTASVSLALLQPFTFEARQFDFIPAGTPIDNPLRGRGF